MTKPKTIVFDLRALQIGHENRGIGMVAKSVLNHLEDETNNYVFYIFSSSNPIEGLGIKLKIKNYIFVETPKLKTSVESPSDLVDSFKLTFHRFEPLRHLRPDAFLQFDFNLGLPSWRKTKTICIGYDLIPLIMKNQYLPSPKMAWNQPGGRRGKIKGVLRSIYYRARYRKNYSTFKKADKILCISEATRQSFLDLLGISPKKAVTIPLAPVLPKTDLIEKVDIDKPYIFYIGGTDSRKHVADVIHAFNIAKGRGQDIALVLAGNEFKKINHIPDVRARNAIIKSPYKADIHLAGFVSDSEKVGLYKHALAFVFCSTYEGFGLPVLEAQALACPVICYDNSSIPEVASSSVFFVETGDVSAIARKMEEIAAQDREKIVGAGLKFVEKFSWEKYTKHLLDQLER